MAPAFVDGELMGKKVKVEGIVKASRVENRGGRSYVHMSIATNFASDTKVCMYMLLLSLICFCNIGSLLWKNRVVLCEIYRSVDVYDLCICC